VGLAGTHTRVQNDFVLIQATKTTKETNSELRKLSTGHPTAHQTFLAEQLGSLPEGSHRIRLWPLGICLEARRSTEHPEAHLRTRVRAEGKVAPAPMLVHPPCRAPILSMTRTSPFLEVRTVELSALLANHPLCWRPDVVGVAGMTIVFPLPMPGMVASGTWRAWRTLARKLVVAALASELRLSCVLARFLCFGLGTTPGSHS
jgi:hypothetical protein